MDLFSFSYRTMLQAARLHYSLQQHLSGGLDDAEADAVHLFCGLAVNYLTIDLELQVACYCSLERTLQRNYPKQSNQNLKKWDSEHRKGAADRDGSPGT